MENYLAFMAGQIADEIKAIEDPRILHIYLTAIQYQRCRLCGSKKALVKTVFISLRSVENLIKLLSVKSGFLKKINQRSNIMDKFELIIDCLNKGIQPPQIDLNEGLVVVRSI